jgi:hypothetical protein
MSRIKKILLGSLMVFIAIQFIQPARNKNGQVIATDISKIYSLPQSVQATLKTACYDCHSNNTNYPWYSNIQPVGWMMARHIKEGKDELNLSEFGSYSERRQLSKLRSIENSIKDGSMPISSYTIIHKNARLTKEEKAQIIDWAKIIRDSLANRNK